MRIQWQVKRILVGEDTETVEALAVQDRDHPQHPETPTHVVVGERLGGPIENSYWRGEFNFSSHRETILNQLHTTCRLNDHRSLRQEP
jgi:hypothetical protein